MATKSSTQLARRSAAVPHTLVFVNCRRFTIRDVSFVDSANYAIFFQISDDVEVRNVKFIGGWDGVHFRGAP
jgi:polygalacturonase